MCDPATALLAITTISSVGSFIGGNQQADFRTESIVTNTQQQLTDIAARRVEEDQDIAEAKSEEAIEALKRKATVRVASGEAGLQGGVVSSLLQDVDTQTGRDIATLEEQRKRKQRQLSREEESIKAKTKSSLNLVERPTFAELGLQIAGGAADFAASRPTKKAS